MQSNLSNAYDRWHFWISICCDIGQVCSTEISVYFHHWNRFHFSCTLWLLYGYTAGNSTIMTVNAIGGALQFAYALVYLRFTPDKVNSSSFFFSKQFLNFNRLWFVSLRTHVWWLELLCSYRLLQCIFKHFFKIIKQLSYMLV